MKNAFEKYGNTVVNVNSNYDMLELRESIERTSSENELMLACFVMTGKLTVLVIKSRI